MATRPPRKVLPNLHRGDRDNGCVALPTVVRNRERKFPTQPRVVLCGRWEAPSFTAGRMSLSSKLDGLSSLTPSTIVSERHSCFVDRLLRMVYKNLDTNLINELLDDGRVSMRSLAEILDISVTTVSSHLQDLEETGVIRGYSPVVDYNGLGYDVTAVIQFIVDGTALSDVTENLREHRQILSVYEVTGRFDIIVIGKFRDISDMNDHIKSFLNESGINDSNTSVVLNKVNEYEQFKLDIETSSNE